MSRRRQSAIRLVEHAIIAVLASLCAACQADQLVSGPAAVLGVVDSEDAEKSNDTNDVSLDVAQPDGTEPQDVAGDAGVTDANAGSDADDAAQAPDLAEDSADDGDGALLADAVDAGQDVTIAQDGQAVTDVELDADAGVDSQAEVAATGGQDAVDVQEVSLADGDSAGGADADAQADTGAEVDAGPACWQGKNPNLLCLHWGQCASGLQLTCLGPLALCDYGKVDKYQQVEKACDGLDNDCNGLTDDELPAPYAVKNWGVCAGSKQVCAGAAGWQEPDYATLPGYQTQEAACDGLDNDCNGLTDDLAAPEEIPKFQGVCAKGPFVCVGAAGWDLLNPAAVANYEPYEQTCDGLDNDCDGFTDENLYLSPAAAANVPIKTKGVCAGTLLSCVAGQWQAPDYAQFQVNLQGLATPTYEAVEQTCDGLDNDCNGLIDDGLLSPPSPQAKGVCAGLAWNCAGAVGWVLPELSAIPGYSADSETTCDAQDNDCDGLTDEDVLCPLWQRGGQGAGRVALVPDGKTLFWTSAAGVHGVDLGTGARILDHFGHQGAVTDVAVAADGLSIVSSGGDQVLRHYPALAPAGSTLATAVDFAVTILGAKYQTVAFSPNNQKFAVGDANGLVHVYGADGTPIASLDGHKTAVTALAWLQAGANYPDNLVSGDKSGLVLLWHLQAAQAQILISKSAEITSITADPSWPYVTVTALDLQPKVVNTDSGQLVATLLGHNSPVAASGYIDVAPAGAAALPFLHTIDVNGELRRWSLPPQGSGSAVNLGSLQVWNSPPLPPGDVIADLATAGTVVVAGAQASGPWRLDIKTGQWSRPEIRHDGAVLDLAASQGVVASAGDDALVRLWSRQSGLPLLNLVGHQAGVQAVTLQVPAGADPADPLAAGAHVASGSFDFSVRLWQVLPSGGKVPGVLAQKTFGLGGPWPEDLAATLAGTVWCAGGSSAQLFGTGVGNLGVKIAAYSAGADRIVQSVRPSPDGATLLLGLHHLQNPTASGYRLLQSKNLQVIWDSSGLDSQRQVASWRPDGLLVAVSGGSGFVQLIDAKTGVIVQSLLGHTADVVALDWSSNGQRLLSASVDGTARVWAMAAPNLVQPSPMTRHCPLPCAGNQVRAAVWLDAGQIGATAADDGSLIAWHIP